MAAAMAYCTSNPAFYQHSLNAARTQFTPIARRANASPSTFLRSNRSTSHVDQPCIKNTVKSDENNNNHHIENIDIANSDDVLHIVSDNDDDDDDEDHDVDVKYDAMNNYDEEQFLSLVGLRRKTKRPIVRNLDIRPLTKRLACPVCLLPLPKYSERVRQALYIRLPFLKFLSITTDIDRFCSTDAKVIAQSLLPRSVTQSRASYTLQKSRKRQKLKKADSINMNSRMSRNNPSKTSIKNYVSSILQCQVVLDRLEQTTINQILQNSAGDDENNTLAVLTPDHAVRKTCKARRSLPITTNKATTTATPTTITTMTTEKSIVKRKSTTADEAKSKRAKTLNNSCSNINDDNCIQTDDSSITYQRIYLKCFVCSKRQYVDAKATNSDVLHSHWLEHDRNLSLNIYDSEINSILTRVVEFFNSPKQHVLEGKIKTVFILNSKEIRYPSTINSSSNDSCIVID